MKIQRLSILLLAPLFLTGFLFGQRGKDGAKTITAANTIVNEYTNMTSNIVAGSTALWVASSSMNANGRFAGNLAPGDLVMIYNVTGVAINGYQSGIFGLPKDTTWGKITNYYQAGLFEFAQVKSIPDATTINLDCPVKNTYYHGSNFKTVVVRVPRYTSLTINSGGVLTCEDWNGFTGGVLAVEVEGNTVINAGGIVDANGKGFRGGSLIGDNVTTYGVNDVASTDAQYGAEKGEGLIGYQSDYDSYGGRYGRGAAANAGGGGDAHNGGGGGGANASLNVNNWKGFGIPDVSTAGYISAWNLDDPNISGLTAANSAGGGRGGYSFSSSNQNATTLGPSNGTWGGDSRNREAAGWGGRALDYSTGRLFFGGGGGAGDQNSSGGGAGGDGGGLIYFMVYGNISGGGTIQSNGNNGGNAQGGSSVPSGIDAAGGGGAGGVIVLNAVGTIANTLTCNTNGGNGGNQAISPTFGTNEAEGPGGGGGGGYIGVSSGTPTRNSNGGNNGTTNSPGLTEFLPNGALKGCPGITNGSVTNFTITALNDTVCYNTAATLTATIGGTPPSGISVVWYDAIVAGNQVGSGTTFTTSPLTATTTFYVGTCPGTYRVPVTVTVVPTPTAAISATSPVCTSAGAFNLSATPAGGTWSGTGITNASNGTFDPAVAGTGTFTITYTYTDAAGCTATDTEQQIVNNGSNATINAAGTVCSNTAAFNMSASPGGGSWSGTGITSAANGTFDPSVSGVGTFTITYTIGGACPSSDQEVVTVTAQPNATISPVGSLCSASAPVTLTAAQGGGVWSGTGITNSANGTFDPAVSGTGTFSIVYTITGTCSDDDTIQVVVNSTANATINSVTPVCSNVAAFNLSAAQGGGTWSGTGITNTATGTFDPSVSGVGSFTVTYTIGGACPSSDQEVVTVNAQPNATINPAGSLCTTSAAVTLSAAQGGGTWSGTGITNTTNGTFDPSVSGAGTFSVVYAISGVCTDDDTIQVVVNATANATITNVSPVCSNANAFNLTAAQGGGTWSGTGITNASSGTFNPVTSGPGTFTVTYTIGGACGNSDTAIVSVNAASNATISPVSSICANAAAFNLSAAQNGGTWSGTGITNTTNGTFDPSVSGTGTFSIVYAIGGACPDDDTIQVVVNNSLNATINNVTPVCSNAAAFNMSAVDNGGAWSGTGITNATSGTFDPAVSGVGTFTVTYTISGSCGNTDTAVVTVLSNANATISPVSAVCDNASAFNLTSAQSGGTWTGTGITNATNGTFDPSVSGAGSFNVIYTIAGQCGDDDTVAVVVNATPDPTINAIPSLCSNGAAINMTAAAAGGTWSGTGITNSTNGTFDPTVSGAGTYTVTYNIAGICPSNDTAIVSVIQTADATIAPVNAVCDNASSFNLTSAQSGGSWSGTGITNTTNGTFDPSVSGAGSFNIIYTIPGQCGDDDTIQIVVNTTPDPTINSVSPLCSNDASVNMTAATAGGTWSGTGITNTTNGTFDPSVSGAGSFILTYDLSGVCPSSDTVSVTVIQAADATITPVPAVCSISPAFNFSSAQSGGTWSGTGITNATNGTFDPAISGTGTFSIIYTIAGNCGDADTTQITVSNTLDPTINAVAQLCQSSGVDTLSAATAGGVWNGTGITDTVNGIFNPAVSGAGTFNVTYSFGGSCPASDTISITVVPSVDATIDSVASVCSGANVFDFTAAQSGGVWSGTGITNTTTGTFDPATSGAGTFTIYYSISGTCSDADSTQITVVSGSDATINTVAALCQSGSAITLTAADPGGVWSGAGITDSLAGTFDPAVSGAGTFTINYLVGGSCADSDTVVINVAPVADATITSPGSVCAVGGPVTLTAAQSGGTWAGTGITNANGGTFDPAVSGTGTFQIVYSINGVCSDDDTLSITVTNTISSAINAAGPFCSYNNAVNLSAANNGGVWSGTGITDSTNGTFDPAVAGAGSFTITYTIAGSCGSTSTTTITVNQAADATITSAPAAICNNEGTVTLSSLQSGGVWSGTGITNASAGIFDPSVSGAGNFSIIYSISGTCGDADTLAVTVNAAPVATALANQQAGCIPVCVSYSTATGANYSWSFGDGSVDTVQNPTYCYNQAGTFTASVVVSNNNCSDTGFVVITANAQATAAFTANPSGVIAPGTTVSFNNTSSNSQLYFWDFGDTLMTTDTSTLQNPSYLFADTGYYCVTLLAINTNGCNDTVTQCLMVVGEPVIEVPNIFTPNGDAVNEVFSIKSLALKDLNCIIFDRWGIKMGEFNGINGFWDGRTTSGNKAPDGTYFFILKYSALNGKEGLEKGYLELIGK